MTKAVTPPYFAPETTSAPLFTIRQHTDSRYARLGSRLYYYYQSNIHSSGEIEDFAEYFVIHCIFPKPAQCASRSGYEDDTQRTGQSLAGPGCLIVLKYYINARDTFRRQIKGSVTVWSDLFDRTLINEAWNRIHETTIDFNSKVVHYYDV